MTGHVQILGIGHSTPTQVLTNEELIARFGLEVDADWIEERTGIQDRHWLEDGQTTSDLATAAAELALERAGVLPSQVERIVLATISPDHPSPSTATIVARKLGARCAAFDLSAACAGFLYGLELGAMSVNGGARNVLVIAADARSRFIDKHDPRSAVLFADGAAAVLLGPGDQPGLLAIHLGAEGRERMGAHMPAGGAAMPTTAATVEAGLHFLVVDGKREIFDLFVAYTREACDAVLARAGIAMGDVDLFITHQGNARMVELTVEALGVDPARAMNNIAHHGNTSSATVPIALSEAIAAGRLTSGQTALLTSVGAGYTFGAALYRMP